MNVVKFFLNTNYGNYVDTDTSSIEMKIDKTFFPQHWSREEVINKIYEAYEDFTKSGAIAHLEKDGKYKIRGLTKEGIKIEMHITAKGHMKTAYPIIERDL